jgi:LysR family nitrogen assimilation transcriptional regulator
MDLNQIEHFLRVAELGSINRAAKELGLSQPALSRSLSQLEHDLGQQLVVRCRTGITITEAGSILASRGLALLSEAGAIREELANDPAGRVVVGMPAALRHLVTLPALQLMRNKSPGTAVRVHEGFNVFPRHDEPWLAGHGGHSDGEAFGNIDRSRAAGSRAPRAGAKRRAAASP